MQAIATIEADARGAPVQAIPIGERRAPADRAAHAHLRPAAGLAESFDADSRDAERLVAMLGETTVRDADLAVVVTPAPQSLSLNVSSSCNLSCGYCYADRGAFGGGQTQTMTFEVASAAVERLLARRRSCSTDHDRLSRRRAAAQPQPDPGRRAPSPIASRSNVASTCAIRSRPTARCSRTPTSTCSATTVSR